MSADEFEEGWAGGADMGAAKAEIARLKKLGEGLRDLTAAAGRISDPDKLAALQDRNIEAFEEMTAQMGLKALDKMRDVLALLADPSKAAEMAAQASEKNAGALAAARAEIEAARDRETEKLLGRLTGWMETAADHGASGARPGRETVFEFDPFDDGPAEETDDDSDRAAAPPADAPAKGDET